MFVVYTNEEKPTELTDWKFACLINKASRHLKTADMTGPAFTAKHIVPIKYYGSGVDNMIKNEI